MHGWTEELRLSRCSWATGQLESRDLGTGACMSQSSPWRQQRAGETGTPQSPPSPLRRPISPELCHPETPSRPAIPCRATHWRLLPPRHSPGEAEAGDPGDFSEPWSPHLASCLSPTGQPAPPRPPPCWARLCVHVCPPLSNKQPPQGRGPRVGSRPHSEWVGGGLNRTDRALCRQIFAVWAGLKQWFPNSFTPGTQKR